jgi:hypothetical protein
MQRFGLLKSVLEIDPKYKEVWMTFNWPLRAFLASERAFYITLQAIAVASGLLNSI